MKKQFLIFWVMMLASLAAVAQTDVTSQYLTNAGFDDETSFVSSTIYTYANDANTYGGVSSCQSVTGWTADATGDGKAGGAMQYGCGYGLSGTGYICPTSDANGNTSGGVLALAGCWNNSAGYSQSVTLPAGFYRISYKVYNAGTNIIANYTNTIGFVESGGTTHYSADEFTSNEWTEGSVLFSLSEEKSGTIHVGYNCANVGSANSPKLFVDYIKIEVYNTAELPEMEMGKLVNNATSAWTNPSNASNSGSATCNGVTMLERWFSSTLTGDITTYTANLPNGIYETSVYCHGHVAWVTSPVTTSGATGYTTLSANGVTADIPVILNTGWETDEPTLYTLSSVPVTNETLTYKLSADVAGANWFTVRVNSLICNSIAVSASAFSLPSTAVTAGYWYQVDIPVAGDYTLNLGNSATISYTQDGTALTSSSFSTTTGGAMTLSAGTLYVKSSVATTIALIASSYGYDVGSASVDKTYVQGGETITVSYADAVSNDPDATLTINTSGITFGGNSISVTATSTGFTFTVPTVTAASTYVLSIPAGAARYGTHASSAAQTINIYSPAVFDGTYYLYNEDGQYLDCGSAWGTRAIVDDWGLPLNVATDGNGHMTFQFIDTEKYLYANGTAAWCDGTNAANENTQWIATLYNGKYRLNNVAQGNTYLQLKANDKNLYLEDAEGSTIQNWTFEQPSAHPAKMAALRTALTALSSEVSGLSSKTYIASNPTATAEEYEKTYDYARYDYTALPVVSGSIAVYPGIYKFSVLAFHRMSTNDVTYSMHGDGTESVPVYAYFGDKKVQLHSIYDASTTTANSGCYTPDDTNYYPNNQATALTAFQSGSYANEIWVRVTEATTLEYGIAHQSALSMAGRWTCYATDGIEITRYYDPATEALSDGDNVSTLINNPTIESNNEGSVPSGWSGNTSSWRWTVGTGDTYMECWNGSASDVNFNMYQTINGLQEGIYELSADMFNSSNSDDLAAQFTGGECGLYASTASAHAYIGVTEDGTDLTTHTLYIYVNEGETLTLGVKNMATPTGRWFGCDNFTLKYRTLDTASSLLIASVPTSQANASLKSAMNSAKMNLNNASTKTGELFNALTSAIADVRVSAANYGHLYYALNNDDSRVSSTPSAVQTEYASLKATYNNYYTNQTASGNCEAEIALVKVTLAQALLNQNESLNYLIVNNSFETGDLTGWTVTTYGSDTGVKNNGGSTYGTDGCDGDYLFNTWASGDKGGYPLKQNIGYLPAGTYKLTGLVTTSAGTVYLLCNNYVSSGTTCDDKTTFLSAAMTFTLNDITEVTIGVAGGDDSGNYTGDSYCWYKADNFQLSTVVEENGGDDEEDDIIFTTNSYFARGSENIFGRFTVSGSSVSITEQGLCYSTTNQEPTVADNTSTDYLSYCGKIFKISNLTPSTAYYVRPYARIGGSIYYGKTHKVYTIARGTITYGIRDIDNATYKTNITNAISTMVDYWNKYTNISGYYVNAGYDDVQTADCSYGGYIRFGSNTSYQQCGTAMHESLHGIGMGTTSNWSTLGAGKTWAGPRVNEFIKFFENSEGATMYGDSQHAWCSNSNGGLSYTINGAQEDAYSDLQRTANSLLAQAYGEDGLKPTSGAYYFVPYYSIEQEDDDVFYIQNSSTGKYLVDNNGTLGTTAYSSLDGAKAAGNAAWTLTFDPSTQWYHITSVKYNNKLSHENYAWGLNKADANINLVKSVNTGKYWLNTPTTDGRNLVGSLSCGTTAPLDTTDANGQDWVFYRVKPEVPILYGDINGDDDITISDLTCLVNILLGDTSNSNYNYDAANVNGDAGITPADVKAIVNMILGK